MIFNASFMAWLYSIMIDWRHFIVIAWRYFIVGTVRIVGKVRRVAQARASFKYPTLERQAV
jgi:hypothetical protein